MISDGASVTGPHPKAGGETDGRDHDGPDRPGETGPFPSAFGRPPVSRGAGGRVLRRVAAELRNWYRTRRDHLPHQPPEFAHQAERAEEFKLLIYEYLDPSSGGDISVPVPKVPFRAWSRSAFWDQVALSRLRFQGDKRTYLVCTAGQPQRPNPGGRRVLVLHPPDHTSVGVAHGGGGDEPGYDALHASRQATFNDTAQGIPQHGLRVKVAALRLAGVPEEELRRVERGYELALRRWPDRHHGRHYGGALDFPEKLQEEHERMLACGFVEGPLHYVPHVVQSLGGVWNDVKQKWRTIVDATSSGVNPQCIPLVCEYDMLPDAVAHMRPRDKLSAFDLTDAFLNWAYEQSHADLMGYRDTKGEYFRYRFLGFGCAQSPAVQQRWATQLKEILNREGLRYCTGRAADYANFQCILAYMDDFAMRHAAHLTDAECLEQFDSVMRVLADLGFVDKVSKRSPPATALQILGFLVDTVDQTVTVTADRCRKLCAEIDAALADPSVEVGRRDLASLIGKLQWVASGLQLPGGQLHLRGCYRARDDFARPVGPSMREQWGRDVRVRRSALSDANLRWWRATLPDLEGTRMYLTNISVANGFWRGAIAETDEELDANGGAPVEDVAVITTDASGYAGGAWWLLERAAWAFDSHLRAPNLSSNYRELLTAILSLERWGPQLGGRRVLIRTDNTTTASVVNTGDTASPLLIPLARRLFEVVKKFDLKLAARHIPGLKNGLSDGLSRRRYDTPDTGDLQLDPAEFSRAQAWLQSRLGRPFDVDACADPVGLNAHCARFYSAVDSALQHRMSGDAIWCHADWELLTDLLAHFRREASERPADTTGVFCVPEQTGSAWWRSLRGFRVLARYPAGTRLFTRPVDALSGIREPAPPAKQPVLLLWWEPGCRDTRAGGHGAPPHPGPGQLGADHLLRLQLTGDGALDAQRLRAL